MLFVPLYDKKLHKKLTVSPRQEAEGAVVAGHEIVWQDSPEADDVGDYVSVRKHHALRLPCRARCVDQSGQLFGVWEVGRDSFACDAPTPRKGGGGGGQRVGGVCLDTGISLGILVGQMVDTSTKRCSNSMAPFIRTASPMVGCTSQKIKSSSAGRSRLLSRLIFASCV